MDFYFVVGRSAVKFGLGADDVLLPEAAAAVDVAIICFLAYWWRVSGCGRNGADNDL